MSPTNWTRTASSSSTNPDCGLWNNDPNVLCYGCQSCKAGLLDNIKSDWKRVAVLNIIFLVFLIVVYSVGCCAFRNTRRDNSYKRYPWECYFNLIVLSPYPFGQFWFLSRIIWSRTLSMIMLFPVQSICSTFVGLVDYFGYMWIHTNTRVCCLEYDNWLEKMSVLFLD